MAEAYATLERWARGFNDGDASAVAALYAPDAVIWGTLAQTLTTTPQDIETYFVQAARAGLKTTLGQHVTSRISDACVVDAGHYDFTRVAGGQTAVIPARYSFVLLQRDGAWMIAHHHSSILPKPIG
ncbi:MAG: SgcJ/EcaC family oxidoreductase [Rhodopseudomonas sp.]|uniref:SgcJ/EcaC family oxidoreductase n=1 Tax=Rhodopseudomonas sp. TaxID=1078 RepID=UPI00183DA734|nr:SgcJ/EcaC family oxidoreductase [Rhodopseudomonas sp.]NVN85379.1 SgcJ/EcaC family oxidoreductase [Rhodopseudomonas sp.]